MKDIRTVRQKPWCLDRPMKQIRNEKKSHEIEKNGYNYFVHAQFDLKYCWNKTKHSSKSNTRDQNDNNRRYRNHTHYRNPNQKPTQRTHVELAFSADIP